MHNKPFPKTARSDTIYRYPFLQDKSPFPLPDRNSSASFIIFLKIDYVKDLLKKSNCDIL